ncbi:MAG: SRPBCC family protein [Xanthomonadales bacterium]|nr:SRPBCC family protein [Xanthomonadales bacterium]
MSALPLVVDHRLAVNAPRGALPRLDRAQLWRGLMLRMRCPDAFLPGLDDCLIEDEGDGALRRRLRFGREEVLDRVVFLAEGAIEVEILVRPGGGSFRQRIAIEEGEDGELWLHFRYEALSPDHCAGAAVEPLLRAAYEQADRALVLRLRELAAAGLLD